ncbi:MAG: MotA/TolQ/ExbB proton channel family protein [Phycisphaeraceae bacterium]|nr:MotA/TolQ/ExbB proton channel family protein [Phycisphaerales bacterium]USN98495.1 MAG: MotA/TolQ/ExbB proton channel family protein [Phycisphaeraceae bacterium]
MMLITLATAAGSSGADRTLLDYIIEAREVGLLIVALSIFVTAVIIAQFFTIRVSRLAPDDHIERLDHLLSHHDVAGAITYCENDENRCLLTRVLGGALSRCARSPFGFLELKNAIEELGEQEVARLHRMTDVIGLVASIAPMLGLLGTVVGMVGAFDVISNTEGPVRPDNLAGNISEALITTIMGLVVAIPCTAIYTFLRNRIDHLVTEIGETIEELTLHIEQHSGQPTTAPAAPPAAARAQPGGQAR